MVFCAQGVFSSSSGAARKSHGRPRIEQEEESEENKKAERAGGEKRKTRTLLFRTLPCTHEAEGAFLRDPFSR